MNPDQILALLALLADLKLSLDVQAREIASLRAQLAESQETP